MSRTDPDVLVAHIGRRIGEVRDKAGWTQEDLASVLGRSVRYVQKLEKGQNITVHTLAKIAKGLKVDPGELLSVPRGTRRQNGRPPRRKSE